LINREHCISCNAPLKIKNLKTEEIKENINKQETSNLFVDIPNDSLWNFPLISMWGIFLIIGFIYTIFNIIQGLGVKSE
jgi:hypothetical protein